MTLDFSEARIGHPTLDLRLDMRGGALRLLTRPGVVVDADGLTLHFAKTRPRRGAVLPPDDGSPPLLRVRITGALHYGEVVAGPAHRLRGR